MRFHSLQIGRFAAALVVLVFHAVHYSRELLGCDVGVTDRWYGLALSSAVVFFFVLSGFVVTHSAQKGTVGRLVVVRLLRFYPTFWIAAGVALLVRRFVGAEFPVENKLFWKGFTLWPFGPGRAAYPLGVEWTLIYEVMLLFGMVPLLLIHRRWGVLVGTTLWLAAIVVNEALHPLTAFPAFPRFKDWPLQVPNAPFLLGAIAYLTYSKWARPGLVLPIVAGTLFFLAASCHATKPGPSFLVLSLSVTLFTGWLVVSRQPSAENSLVIAGDWTYGVYLIHVSVLVAFYSWASTSAIFPPSIATMILGMFLALGVGSLYGYVEYRAFLRVRTWATGRTLPVWMRPKWPRPRRAIVERVPDRRPVNRGTSESNRLEIDGFIKARHAKRNAGNSHGNRGCPLAVSRSR